MPTQRQYRRALGADLGFYQVSTLAMGSTSADTLPIPDFLDSDLEARFAGEVWGYVASTGQAYSGQQRRVQKAGIAPATGVTTFAAPFASTMSSGTQVELSGVLPVVDALGRKGLHTLINEALRECWTVDRISLTPDSSAYQYDLSSRVGDWLEERHLIDVYVRPAGGVRDELLPEWRFLHDTTAQLELRSPLSSADELKLVAYRPLDTWVQTSSGWGASSVGLSTETDAALLPLDGLRTVGRALAYGYLATWGEAANRREYHDLAQEWRGLANQWKQQHLPRMAGRDVHWRERAGWTRWTPILSSA